MSSDYSPRYQYSLDGILDILFGTCIVCIIFRFETSGTYLSSKLRVVCQRHTQVFEVHQSRLAANIELQALSRSR